MNEIYDGFTEFSRPTRAPKSIDEYFCQEVITAIEEGDLKSLKNLEQIGVEIIDDEFLHCSIKNNQLLVAAYQASKGADVDQIIAIAKEHNNQAIWQWANCWKKIPFTQK